MAVIVPRIIHEFNTGNTQGMVVAWDNITENDTCGEFVCAGWPDKTIQITGTLGTGTFAIHGALHPGASRVSAAAYTGLAIPGDTEYVVLEDPSNDTLNLLGLTCVTVLQHTYLIKPIRTGGTGMDADIIMLMYAYSK